MIDMKNLSEKEYMQLRSAALSTVEYTLRKFHATRYAWMDAYEKDDIVSAAVEKALDTFDPEKGSSFKTWLQRQAFQRTASTLKSHRVTTGLSYVDEDGDECEIPELAYGITPEDEFIGREMEEAIDRIVERRSPAEAHVFRLDFQGYKPGEIATQLGKTDMSVYMMLHKTKKAISEKLIA